MQVFEFSCDKTEPGVCPGALGRPTARAHFSQVDNLHIGLSTIGGNPQ